MKFLKTSLILAIMVISTILALPSSAAVGDNIYFDNITYNVVSEPSADGQPGTCVIGYNYWVSGKVIIPAIVFNSNSDPFTVIGFKEYDDGSGAFSSNRYITSISFEAPQNITFISPNTFNGCPSLVSVDLSGCSSLASIGSKAFSGCSSLASVDLSGCSSLVSIGSKAFSGCSSLTSLDFSDCSSLASIATDAFSNCYIKTFSIPSLDWWWNVELENLFSNPMLDGLAELYIGGEKVTHITFPGELSNLGYHLVGCSSLQSVDFAAPKDITSIGNCLFYHCISLSSIDLSECTNLTSIGDSVFYYCTSLPSMDLTECTNLTSIGRGALYGCKNLTSINLPTSLTSIGIYAFWGCNFTSIVLPSSLTSIGQQAFWVCNALTCLVSYAETAPRVKALSIFQPNLYTTPFTSTGILYVPSNGLGSYGDATGWKAARNIRPIGWVQTLQLPQELTVLYQQSQSVTATYTPANAPDVNIVWAVKDGDGIIEIIPDESTPYTVNIKALKLGTCTLTATAVVEGTDEWNTVAECQVNVVVENPITQIDLSLTDLTIAENAVPQTITASLLPENATLKDVTWSLSGENPAAVTIQTDEDDPLSVIVIPQSAGTVTLTATAADGSETTAECKIEIVALESGNINIGSTGNENEPSEWESFLNKGATIHVGESLNISVRTDPAGIVMPELSWTTEAFEIASVKADETDNLKAVLTGMTIGNTQLKISVGDITVTVPVKVIAQTPMTQIELPTTEMTIAKGADPVLVTATVAPENASFKELTWTIEPQDFAEIQTIENTTLKVNINPLATGTAVLTATAADGSDITAQCKVSVVELTADDIIIGTDNPNNPDDPDNPDSSWSSIMGDGTTLRVGESLNISVRSEKADYLPEITWSTLDPTITTVTAFENKNTDAILRGMAIGKSSLSLTVKDIEGTVTAPVTVIAQTTMESINLSLTDFSIAEGAEPVQITATLEPETASHPVLSWSVDPQDIVEIIPDSDPANTLSISVKPLAPGEVTLTATAQDGSDVTASCAITVIKLTGVEIGSTGSGDGGDDTGNGSWGSIMTDGATLHVGESLQLAVRTTPAVDYAPAVTWSTAESSVASVTPDADNSLNATLLGVAIGKTTLTVSVGDLTSTANITVIAENPITSLSIIPKSVELAQNADPFTFEAQITPADATVPTLVWKSDDTSVATVDQNGTVTPVGQGECTVTATTTDGTELYAEATVIVTSPVSTDFDFDFSDLGTGLEGLTLEVGDSYQLKPKANETDAVLPEDIVWTSSEPQTASVSMNGTVTALAVGEAIITASAHVNGQEVSASCTVIVLTPKTKSLSISPSQLTLDDGGSERLTAEFTPSDALPQLEWTVDDQSVIQITPMQSMNQIVITALMPGKATVTVAANDGSGLEAICDVTVKAVPATALSLNIEDATIDVQDAPLTLIVALNPEDATVPELTWTSSDETVATVMSYGGLEATLTPLSAGKTTVTVTHADDASISDSAEITVTDKSSIGDIFTDGTFESGPVDVYDLSGKLIRRQASEDQLQDLRPGIYIFRQGNTSKKILIQ